jgi:hypothetical protein
MSAINGRLPRTPFRPRDAELLVGKGCSRQQLLNADRHGRINRWSTSPCNSATCPACQCIPPADLWFAPGVSIVHFVALQPAPDRARQGTAEAA